jgi:hypothetical protein
MRWLLWFGLGIGTLLIIFFGVRVAGANHWANLIRAHQSLLESGRFENKSQSPISERYDASELEGLPAPVQRYFRAVLKHGQPIIGSVTIEMTGMINLSASGAEWKPFTSIQRVVTRRSGFLWNAEVRLFPGIPVRVEDSYIAGQGQVIAKVLGLFTVAEAQGGGDLARGEFMRYFAEAAWYPTALLPSQGVRWQAVDGASAHATIVDGPLSLTMLFKFDETGLIASVRAESRGGGVGKDMVMRPWDCGLSSYQPEQGMMIPMVGEAAWMQADGRRVYFRGTVKKLSYEFLP